MIALYFDKGVDGQAGREAALALRPYGEVKRVKAEQICREELSRVELLVMPGGRDIFYHEVLAGEKAHLIRSWVEEGGSYLGICAGAYFGCTSIDFERGHDLEVIGDRDLGFFSGIGRGSALGCGLFEYSGHGGAEIAWIEYKGERVPSYYNGGCAFIGDIGPDCEIVARYEKTKEPAAVLCNIGAGRACLMGVHPEFHPNSLAGKHVEDEDLEEYRKNYDKTQAFWGDILESIF